MWRNKVTPTLLQRFDEAIVEKDSRIQRVVLVYRGRFSKLQMDIEVLSAVDNQLQVSVRLCDLPALASLDEIRTVSLPAYA